MTTHPLQVQSRVAGQPTFVVVISGTSGGGKTTLAKNVAQRLDGAVTLHFDDYADLANDPASILGWLERGADPHEIETPELVEALTCLRAGESIKRPNTQGVAGPCSLVVVEDPFGRSRADTAPLIDFAAHLKTPGDVALARRVVRSIQTSEHTSDALLEHLERDLTGFLMVGHEAYSAAGRAAQDAAHLVLDGLHAPEDLADQLVHEIQSRKSAPANDPSDDSNPT